MKHLLALTLLVLLSACSSAPTAPPAPTVDVGAIQTQAALSVHVTETASAPTVTNTSAATSSPALTNTPPAPSATNTAAAPLFQKWSSQQVVALFQSAGLEVVSPLAVTKADYGASPMVAVEGTHFLVPSLCSDCGGRIFSFDNARDLGIMQAYYVNLGKSSALFFSWVFVKDNILVQINGDLPEAKAKAYDATLQGLH